MSFVSVEGARRNLAAETSGARASAPQARAGGAWDVAAAAGRGARRPAPRCGRSSTPRSTTRTRSHRAPSATSAARYLGMDGLLHDAAAASSTPTSPAGTPTARRCSCSRCWRRGGRADCRARCSPTPRESGCLPRWPTPTGRAVMVGDSADPLIAGAHGVRRRGFDRRAALAAMVRGATATCRSANGRLRRAPGPRRTTCARLRPLRARHQRPQRELDLSAARRRSGARRRRRSSTRSPTSRSPSSPRRLGDAAHLRARSCARSGNWRNALQPPTRLDRAALRRRRALQPVTTTCAAAGLRRGQLRPVHAGWCPTTPRACSRAWAGAAKAARPARPLPAQAQRRPGAPAPRAARQRADPAHALALRLGSARPTGPRPVRARCSALQHRARRLSRQRRPRHAVLLVRVRRARPLPGGAGLGLLAIGSPLFRHATVGWGAARSPSTRPPPGERRRTCTVCASTAARWPAPGSCSGSCAARLVAL